MPVRSLKDGTIKISDDGGSGGGDSITVDVEEGDFSWTEHHPANIILDRGVLDHARKANEVPLDWSFNMRFQSLTIHVAIPPYEALKGIGGASGWTSDEPNSDVYAVILELVITDPGGGASETIIFVRAIPEEVTFTEGDPHNSLSASGRAVIVAPSAS